MTPQRPNIDVSHLPGSVLDHRSPVWWGNLMLIMIENTMFAILISTYFYFRLNYEQWPPPQSNWTHALLDPNPDLLLPTLNLLVILFTAAPMLYADRKALHRDKRGTTHGLMLFLASGIAAIVLRFYEFPALHFKWYENAYASTVWTLLGLHLLHLFIGVLEIVIMLAWLMLKGLDDKHARDVRVTAVYWYWVVGTWVIIYFVVYFAPRLL